MHISFPASRPRARGFALLFLALAAGHLSAATDRLDTIYAREHGLPDFPDFGFMLPSSSYHGRVFVLSQDFPDTMPPVDDGVKKILAIDFHKDWKAYAMAVRDYAFEGNIEAPDYENDFFLEDNKVRPWYHVPWQHWGPTGREGFHGLTQEGPIAKQMLAPEQTQTSHAYAVGFYNDLGGYTIGRVWANPRDPDLSVMANGHGFPVGTVVAKLLFTTLDEKEVPYLKDPVTWQAYVYAADVDPSVSSKSKKRVQAPVHVIQMDIMVRDPRADATGGWVFGTFVYNGAVGESERWRNLVPVGLMWGNDPEERTNLTNPEPVKTETNPKLTETVINPGPEMPAMHLGWGFRLNGPVDNPLSSCMSCHSTAQYPVVSAIMPFLNTPPVNPPKEQGEPAGDAWMRWFRNVHCTVPFDPGQAVSVDYSLQLAKSIENFIAFRTEVEQGLFSVQYWENGHDVHRGTLKHPSNLNEDLK